MHKKPIFWIGSLIGVLLLLILSIAIYIGTRSDEWWRDQLTSTLARALDREVEILGEFRLDLGRKISTEATALRISNPDWAKEKDMLRVGSLRLEFDLLSVLGDTMLIHRLELTDMELTLEENQDGEKNWVFTDDADPKAGYKPNEDITLPVYISQFSMQRAQFSLNQPRRTHPVILRVNTITGGQTPDDNAVLNSSGKLGDLPFWLKGSLGRISSALNGGPFNYTVNGILGKASLSSQGSIDSISPLSNPQINLIFSGPEILQITKAMGAPKIAEGPFDTHVNISPGDRGVNTRIRSKFGTLQLDAVISSEKLTAIENMDLNARLTGGNLAALVELLELPPLPKEPFTLDTVLHRDNNITRIDKMIASVAQHQFSVQGTIGAWPKLKNTRLELQANGPDLAVFTPTIAAIGLGKLPAGAYSADVLIESDKNDLRVRPFKMVAGDFEVTAEGRIVTRDKFRTELNVMASGPDLSMVSRLAKTIQLPDWPFQSNGKIAITGKDITLINATGTMGPAAKHSLAVDGPIAFSSKGPLKLDVKGSGPSLQAVLQGLGYDIIPASAAYQVEGKVEIKNNSLVVTAKNVHVGQAEASASLSIPDLNTPTNMTIDVHELITNDTANVLEMLEYKLNIPPSMPAKLSGQIRQIKGAIGLLKVSGSIGTTSVKMDGRIGAPPKYANTSLNLDIKGTDLEYFLPHHVEQAIPFHIKGRLAQDKGYTRFENIQLKVANIEAEVQGQVGDWERISGTELSITAKGPNLDVIAAILNRSLPAGSVKFDGHVRGTEETFHIDRMNLQLGQSNLSGDLKLTRGKPPLLKGQVSSTYLDLAPLRKELESRKTSIVKGGTMPPTGEPETDEVVQQQKKQSLFFQDTPLTLEVFDRLDLDLDIHIDEVANISERGALHDLKAKVRLSERDLSVSDFEVRGAIGDKLQGNLELGRDTDLARLKLDVSGQQLRIGLATAPGQALETYPPADIEAKLSAAGRTYHELAASLGGRIKVIQGEGRINNSSIEFLFSDVFYQLFQNVNPFAKTERTTRLNCGVYITNFANGIAEVQDIVIQTDKLTIVSAGTIDLRTERINVGFQTRPRRGVGISASMITNPLIRLGGTITRPAIELDPTRASVATGAAVATGGLSILFKGVWDRYFTSRDPCGEALKRDAELQTKKASQPNQELQP